MPRPQRIEYENAFYHVMNRGRGRQLIFHDESYYHAFLGALSEAHERFNVVVHAYCLMGNHYHLLLETPDGNLSRVMRHINGVYTQRYNRLKKTDGPLFRGRFKSILVERDAYLLQLSRYIHRNPIDMRKPLVKNLADYSWSSYPAYINQANSPKWLIRDKSYELLGARQRYKAYKRYVMAGVDDETQQFYSRGNYAGVVGQTGFRAWVYEELLPNLEDEKKAHQMGVSLGFDEIVSFVASAYGVEDEALRKVVKGPQKQANEGRKIAMYFCQELASGRLKDIADYFHLKHVGSVSSITSQVRKQRRKDPLFSKQLSKLAESIIIQAT